MAFYGSTQVSIHILSGFSRTRNPGLRIWVDEAFSIDYIEEQNDMPIYGWDSIHYDRIAPGKVLVRGSLIVNKNKKHYMNSILLGRQFKLGLSEKEKETIKIRINSINGVFDKARTNVSVGGGATTLNLLNIVRLKKILNDDLQAGQSVIGTNPTDGELVRNNGFNVHDHTIFILPNSESQGFGQELAPVDSPSLIITGVKFNSQSTSVTIESSNNIKDAFTFIGREVREIDFPG